MRNFSIHYRVKHDGGRIRRAAVRVKRRVTDETFAAMIADALGVEHNRVDIVAVIELEADKEDK